MRGLAPCLTPLIGGLILLAGTHAAFAHQPVMDMAPRWKGGYGFQLRLEHYGSDSLRAGNRGIDNPAERDQNITKLWLEGIYTFKRELRLSVKIPYIDQRRTVIRDGMTIDQSGRGLGDIIIGLPLKRYSNQATATRNIAFTPSVRLPTGSTHGDWPVGDGSIDVGISLSASFEKASLYQYYDLFYWRNGDGKRGITEGDELGLDINVGLHPYHDNMTNQGLFVMLDVSARHQQKGRDLAGVTGGKRLNIGPVLVYYRDNLMLRAEYKHPLYENLEGTQLSRGVTFTIGAGLVF